MVHASDDEWAESEDGEDLQALEEEQELIIKTLKQSPQQPPHKSS